MRKHVRTSYFDPIATSAAGRWLSGARKALGSIFALLASLVLFQGLAAGEARATDWVVNMDDTGFDPIPAGGTAVYSITVENNALPSSTSPINTITLTIPANAEFTGFTGVGPGSAAITGCTPVPAPGPATVTCNVPALAGRATATLKANVLVTVPGTITVVADVPTLGIDQQPANNTVSQSTTVTEGTDIQLTVDGPASAASGSVAAFVFTANNLGPFPASNLEITIPIPSGLANIVAPANCALSGANYICTIAGPVPAGASASLTLNGQISTVATSTITVGGSLTGSSPPDPIPANNTNTADTRVTAGSDLKVTKSRTPAGTLLVGDTANFILAPSYTGDNPFNITVIDDVPANFRIDSVTPAAGSGWSCSVTGQRVTCTRTSGDGPGANIPLGTITIATTILSPGTTANIVEIEAESPLDPNPGNNRFTLGGIVVQEAGSDLRANKSGPANPALVVVGQSYNFNISATNLGNRPFSGTMVMTDQLPAGLQVTSYTLNGWSCSPAVPVTGPAAIVCERVYTEVQPLAINATTPVVTLRALVLPGATSVSNSMTVSSENALYPDFNLDNNTATTNAGVTGETAAADLLVQKTAALASLASGEEQTFDITIYNLGPSPSANVTLTDDLTNLVNNLKTGPNPGLVSVTTNNPNLNCTLNPIGGPTGRSGRLTCTMAAMPVCLVGSTCPTATVIVRPGGDGGNRTNTARAVSSTVGDPNIVNNTGSATYAVEPRAEVAVTKSVTPASPIEGENFSYIVAASTVLDGRSAATNVTVTDTLPSGLLFLSASPSTGSCTTTPVANTISAPGNNQVICNLGTVANGAQQTVTIIVRPTTVLRNQTIENNVTVSTDAGLGDQTGNNNFQLFTPILPPSLDLQVNKTDSPDPVEIGQTTVYSLLVINNGRSAAENVVVTDTLPATGLRYVSHEGPADGDCTDVPAPLSQGQELVCSFPLLLAGESRLITLTMEAVSGGVVENKVEVSSDETVLGFDTNTANNIDNERTTVRTRVDLELTKTPSSPTVGLLQPFNFTILIRNRADAGLSEAEEVQLSDSLPEDMELTATPTASFTAGTATQNSCTGAAGSTSFTCSFGRVVSGGEIAVTVPVRITRVTAPGQVFTNTALVESSSIEIDPSDNTASGSVTVNAASISGTVFRDFADNGSLDGNDTGIAGITVNLAGTDSDGSPVSLTATTGSNGDYAFLFVPPGTYTLTRGTVTEAHLTDGNAIAGSAGGTASPPATISGIVIAGNETAVDYDFTLIPVARIGIAKAVATGPTVNPDGTFDVSFRLRVNNLSLEPLDDVTVTDPLQGGAPLFGTYQEGVTALGTYTVVAAPSGSCGGLNSGFNGAGSQTLASGFTLAAGTICTIDVALRVRPTDPPPPLVSGARYFNQATVSGVGGLSGQNQNSNPQLFDLSTNGANADPNGNGIANEPGENEPTPVSPPDFDVARLGIEKVMSEHVDADGNGVVSPNDTLSYTITATNTGNITLTNVVVSDNRITPGSTSCATLAPTQTCVLTGSLTVTIDDAQAGEVVNTATADSDETEPVQDTVTVPVRRGADSGSLSKTALVSSVKRGERVPFEIRAKDVAFSPARIIDIMPPGFSYVPGSARANGAAVEPAVNGRNLTFDGLTPNASDDIEIELTLVATSAAATGDHVNRAQLVDPATGEVVATAQARVTILEEAVFDCSDIIGKVFDDKNRNGYQDEGEPGLPGVRLATVKGLLVTTDPYGRFSIACADIPDQDIGSNFIVKLDTRTLPTGYSVTSENPRKVRLTRGKMVKLNFGAAIGRLVSLDLNDKVFSKGRETLSPKWQAGLDRLIAALAAEPSSLRITYVGEGGKLAKARIRAVSREIQKRWAEQGGGYKLTIESRIVAAEGGQ